MNKSAIILGVVLLLVATNCPSQTLTVSTNQLNFGIVKENSSDSLQLTVYNPLVYDVWVTGIKFYNIYNQSPFSASNDSFIVWSQSSKTIWVKFSPHHNIYHNSEMVIENNSHGGNVSVDLIGQGRYSNNYYDSTENKSEEDLKNTIRSITSAGYVSLGYSTARDSMFMVIDNQAVNGQGASQNTLECVYTGRKAVGYTSRTDCQNNFSFNTEHTFPQGFFSSTEPMLSDLHHLFPTDDVANNTRANYPFGIVSSPSWQNGGSKYANNLFEPRDKQKGATARAMMYFVLRYQNYSSFFSSQETILRNWHTTFPPTSAEIVRNDKISALQNNRNPFVDYPQFSERIQSFSNTSVASQKYSVDYTQPQIDFGYVASSTAHQFNYVIVNDGNQDIQFTNFSLAPSGILSFQNGTGSNTLLHPGESLTLNIELFTAPVGVINGTLQCSTNIPGQGSVSIPIYVSGSSPVSLEEMINKKECIYPNPTYDILYFDSDAKQVKEIKILDIAGREIQLDIHIDAKSVGRIEIQPLTPGIYFLRLSESGKTIPFVKMWKGFKL